MATPKTPVPATPSTGLSPSSIADAGDGLIRLCVAAITLPLTAANSVGAGLSRLISSVTAALDGNALPQGGTDLVKAASDLAGATAGLYVGLLKAVVSGLDAATRALNAVTTDATTPPRK